jgi:tetratricopeptide (TPR) repeat protein
MSSSASASLPAELLTAVLNNLELYPGSAGVASAKVALLAESALCGMLPARAKVVLTILVAGAVVSGTLGYAHRSFSGLPAEVAATAPRALVVRRIPESDTAQERRQLLDQAWKILDRLPPTAEKVYLLVHVAKVKTETSKDGAPLFAHALQTIDELRAGPERQLQDRLRYCAATNQAECGEIGRALDTCRLIQDPTLRCEALVQIINIQAQRDDWDGAFETFREIQAFGKLDATKPAPGAENKWRREADNHVAQSLSAIARWQARKGRPIEARRTVEAIDNLRRRALALAELANAEADVEDQTEAKATTQAAIKLAMPLLNSSKEPQENAELRLRVASALAAVGQVDEAREMAWGLPQSWQAKFLSNLAVAQIAAGRLADASRIADELPATEPLARARLLQRLARAQARNQDLIGALGTADRVQDPVLQLYARMAIGWIVGQNGDHAEAAQILADCFQRVPSLPTNHPVFADARDNAWYNLAQIQAEFGNEKEMLNWVASQERPLLKVRVWLGVNEGLAARTATRAGLKIPAFSRNGAFPGSP